MSATGSGASLPPGWDRNLPSDWDREQVADAIRRLQAGDIKRLPWSFEPVPWWRIVLALVRPSTWARAARSFLHDEACVRCNGKFRAHGWMGPERCSVGRDLDDLLNWSLAGLLP